MMAVGLLPALASAAPPASGEPIAFSSTGEHLSISVPASTNAPGYTVDIATSPFQVTTRRDGRTVLQTTAASDGTTGPVQFRTDAGWANAISVRNARWHDGVLDLTLATTVAADTVAYRINPKPDRYRTTWSVHGSQPAHQVGTHYRTAASGHWYGQGEAQTPGGGPYTRQPWPLDSGTVEDPEMGPAEYLMTDPFWFTQRATGLWVDTRDVMDVAMNAARPGVFGYTLTDSTAMDSTTFVESTPHDVYADYIGITGTPAKSDATLAEFKKPLWNSWAQYYTSVSESSTLAWAKGLHDAGIPAHAVQVDDGWMSHYGDFTFNSKFPTPKLLSRRIHDMGYDFGLWVTLWINTDADNHAYAAQHGYLLKSKSDPSKPCDVDWWNGTAGIVDLANPDARAWFAGKLHELEQTYGVDGFKFDTRFFDESCAPYPGYTAQDYLTLGAQFTDQFDQQGAGVRISWTGSQKYGFVIREVDKGTGWDSLHAAVSQDLAISTIGYPFVETDMIGGSLSQPPPTKTVLVRWSQAASLMPLMYSSTSPLGVSSPSGTRTYDQQTVDLYRAAVRSHEQLAPYLDEQVRRAVATGEPIMKPLFFDYPQDQPSYTIDDEWLLGDSLLAAPVLTDGTSRDIHLPAGSWFDTLRNRVVTGPTTLPDYHAGLSQTPTFVKLGTDDSAMLANALGAGRNGPAPQTFVR